MHNRGKNHLVSPEPGHCPLCLSAVRYVLPVEAYPLRACDLCHFEFLAPQPDDAALTAIYTRDYFLHGQVAEAEVRMSSMKRATAVRYLNLIGRMMPGSGRRLLEI